MELIIEYELGDDVFSISSEAEYDPAGGIAYFAHTWDEEHDKLGIQVVPNLDNYEDYEDNAVEEEVGVKLAQTPDPTLGLPPEWREGMPLHTVNGEPVSDWSFNEVMEAIVDCGRPLTLEFQRNRRVEDSWLRPSERELAKQVFEGIASQGDKPGSIEKKELIAAFQGQSHAFSKMETSGDGAVDWIEWLDWLEATVAAKEQGSEGKGRVWVEKTLKTLRKNLKKIKSDVVYAEHIWSNTDQLPEGWEAPMPEGWEECYTA